jgi:8-oxo-dGTP diphosphatase
MQVADPMDVVRAFYQAVNRSDLDAITALYHPDCVVEHVFTSDADVYEGREVVRQKWAAEFERYAGALGEGRRIVVDRVAGIETGWGWVRADWSTTVTEGAGPATVESSGHSHFWLEDGLIRRHRSVRRNEPRRMVAEPPRIHATRQYPSQPIVGVGAVIMNDDGRVVLVKRRHEPLAGQWSLPGGALELGETLEAGTAREILEETGLVVDVGAVIEVFDRILVDEDGKTRYHFVLVDYLCAITGGVLRSGSDVDDVVYADPADLGTFRVVAKARDVIARAVRMKGDAAC